MKKKISAFDVVLAVLSAFLFVGILFIFKPCGPKEDGSWMRCHWAGISVAGVAAVLTVISIARFFLDSKVKTGTDIAIIPSAILAALLPGTLISLCGMKTMVCHTATKPAVIVISILIALTAAADLILLIKSASKNKAGQQ